VRESLLKNAKNAAIIYAKIATKKIMYVANVVNTANL